MVRLLGEGGQGQVYEAILEGPAGFRKRVALKVLHDGDGLRREARIGGLLCHPNLVDVYEVGEVDGTWFCAMEHCGGGSLADAPQLSPRAIVEVGLQVCRALDYAHEALGLVHLDLKPANLLLHGATVKVADLGIARARGFSDDGGPRGTLAYMAPEQFSRQPLDPRADVHALGVVLLELARGVTERNASTVTTDSRAVAAVGGPGPSLRDRDSLEGPADTRGSVAWLAPITTRALAFDREDRYPSMRAFAEALETLDVTGPSLAELVETRTPPSPLPDPPEEDAFVGRSDERTRLAERLDRPGLVLLKGPGGVGKTRLAREVVRDWAASRGATLWSVDLAPCRTRMDVLGTIAAGLQVPLTGGTEDALLAQLRYAIASAGTAVLQVDTLEHLPDAGRVLAELRRMAPQCRVVATSRSPIAVDHTELAVDPLPEDDALALLATRVRARGHDLADDPALRAIATRLDGVPFALELAAARIGVLSPAEVLDRLEVHWLRSAAHTSTERDATLTGALDWSWQLLEPAGQDALRQLSVFVGGFTAEAAERVLGDPASFVLDRLQSLTDRSWLFWRDGRFQWLETARAFAAQGDRTLAEARHREYFAAFATPGALRWAPPDRRRAVRRDLDNVVAACRSAIRAEDGSGAVATLSVAWALYEDVGPLPALPLIDAVAAMPLSPPERATVDLLRGAAAVRTGHDGEPALQAAVAGFRAAGDRRGESEAWSRLAYTLQLAGDPRAPELLRDALALAVDQGYADHEARCRIGLGLEASVRGDRPEAVRYLRDALRRMERSGEPGMVASAHTSLAFLQISFGHRLSAFAHALTALALHRALGNRRAEGVALGNLGSLYESDGELAMAERLTTRCLEVSARIGNRRQEGIATNNLGALNLIRERWSDAVPFLEAALAIHEETQNHVSVWTTRCGLAVAYTKLGELDRAREHCDAAEPGVTAYPLHAYRLLLARAALAAAEHDLDGAKAWIDRCRAHLQALGVHPDAPAWASVHTLAAELQAPA
ncbi:MAG: protein kinase [Myxococcota bacterium]